MSPASSAMEDTDLRRGPWTVDEDLALVNYIAAHGEGRWNSLARCAGLRRTGKSCRLRWLNYLRPDVRRGNITPEEQLVILDLHSRLGNRWSKIARHLPGRTDNEIKNYWRTRVQKHAKQLRCDVNSEQFKHIMRYVWIPRLVERIREAGSAPLPSPQPPPPAAAAATEPAAPLHPRLEHSSCSHSGESLETTTQLSSPPPASAESFGWVEEAQLGSPGGGWLLEMEQTGWGESLWSVEDIWLQQQL